ncbi:MAG TPA: mevalonate kinase [Gammaproteobacteria bacterium]|jgi:mevalonate kinase|nr:mevalonate kinase [Gammaproteobacteria bacterium]
MSYSASAPGSLMLLGEYAVLSGKQALVCAVDKRVTVTLTPRDDWTISLYADCYGSYVTHLAELKVEKPFEFALSAIKQLQAKLTKGFDLHIHSDFSDQIGFGSSAAVTVATLAVLVSWLGVRTSPLDLVRQGREAVRRVQGVGSGADIAASVYGGIVAYQAEPMAVEKINMLYPLTVLYAGYKTKTTDAIAQVEEYFSAFPKLYRSIVDAIGQCVTEGIALLRSGDEGGFGKMMTTQQGMMKALGVSTPQLCDMASHLNQQLGISGAKISGAGLGDCVIGLGQLPSHYGYHGQHQDVSRIWVEMTLEGTYCEKT